MSRLLVPARLERVVVGVVIVLLLVDRSILRVRNISGGAGSNRTQVRVADDIEGGCAGQSQSLAISPSPCRLQIEDRIQIVFWILNDLRTQIQGSQQRGLVFASAEQAIGSLVGRMKRAVRLEDDVSLSGNQKARVLPVRKHRGCRIIGAQRWRRRIRPRNLSRGISGLTESYCPMGAKKHHETCACKQASRVYLSCHRTLIYRDAGE